MPGTNINQNYVKGIPPANSIGPTYGLHNDEGSAYITENDNVLDIDPGVTYTINCEDFGAKHDLTIRRTYATVNKMGANPPNSVIDPPVAVPDNVWPQTQYNTCVGSGIQDAYRSVLPSSLLSPQDYVFPASASVAVGTSSLTIRSTGDARTTVWFAPAGTTRFTEGATMTKAAGNATSIAVPASAGTYKLSIVDAQGTKRGRIRRAAEGQVGERAMNQSRRNGLTCCRSSSGRSGLLGGCSPLRRRGRRRCRRSARANGGPASAASPATSTCTSTCRTRRRPSRRSSSRRTIARDGHGYVQRDVEPGVDRQQDRLHHHLPGGHRAKLLGRGVDEIPQTQRGRRHGRHRPDGEVRGSRSTAATRAACTRSAARRAGS